MEALITSLFKRLNRRKIALEVEEELSFHIELLRREHMRQGMSPAMAKDATLKRFGDLEQIKTECVEISRRSHPLMRALKSFLILIFLAGVLMRVFSNNLNVRHIGDLLMAVGALSRLLLYARGLSPTSFSQKSDISSPLLFNDASRMPPAAYNERMRTPVERVISDE